MWISSTALTPFRAASASMAFRSSRMRANSTGRGVRLGRVVGHEAHLHLTAADAAGGVEHARQGLQLIGGKVGRQAEDLQPGLVAQGLGLCRLGLDAAQPSVFCAPVAQGKGTFSGLFSGISATPPPRRRGPAPSSRRTDSSMPYSSMLTEKRRIS